MCIWHYFIFIFITNFVAMILEDNDASVTEAHGQSLLVL